MHSTIDLNFIENESPLSVLYSLSLHRLISILELISKITDLETHAGTIFDTIIHPINPLFLASLISISIIKKQDYRSLLSNYINGLDLPGLEKTLLKVPNFDSEGELETFLEIETKYVQALRLLPLQLLLPHLTTEFDDLYPKSIEQLSFYFRQPLREFHQTKIATYLSRSKHIPLLKYLALPKLISPQEHSKGMGLIGGKRAFWKRGYAEMNGTFSSTDTQLRVLLQPDPSSSLAERWERLKTYDILEDWKFDRFAVLYYAWIIFNPHYLALGMGNLPGYGNSDENGKLAFNILNGYLHENNSVIMNNQEYYIFELNELKKYYAGILKSSRSKDEKKAALVETKQKLANTTVLVRRAHRFYQWMPEEIFAHGGEAWFISQDSLPRALYWVDFSQQEADDSLSKLKDYGE